MSDLILYDPDAKEGDTRTDSDGRLIRYVAPEIYYPAQLAHITNVTVAFLNIGPAGPVPEERRKAVDDALADAYWNRYQGCLTPPRVLAAIKRAAGEARGREFAELLDRIRSGILKKETSLEDAANARTELRIAALRMGAAGKLTDLQTSVLEAVTDLFYLERASMEDVIRAEAEREGDETRAAVLHRYEEDADLTFESALPTVIQSSRVLQAIPNELREPLEAYAQRREMHWRSAVFPLPEE